MANRRMISVNIRKSKKLARLRSDFARLCWTWIIPFTDDYGRFEADPDIFKATVFPLIKTATERRIADALTELSEAGLVILYSVDSSLYGEIVKFEDFQTFKNDRTRKSEYPGPDQGKQFFGIQWNPADSTWRARELNLTKLKLTKDNNVVVVNKVLLSLQEEFPAYFSVNDDDLSSLSQEFPSIDIDTVLRDLLAWERGNPKPTKNGLLRLRNFCKVAAKGSENGKARRSLRIGAPPGKYDHLG